LSREEVRWMTDEQFNKLIEPLAKFEIAILSVNPDRG
jgi:hypothetical protein